MNSYPVINVPLNAPDFPEQLGTKPKFWFDENRFLFKEARIGTGEDWSEKVVCELCEILGIPHAKYDLGMWNGKRGVVTENFVPPRASLIPGNQILVRINPRYPTGKLRGVRHHTLRIVHIVVGLMKPPVDFLPFPGVTSARHVFAGYLMLDALVGNNDRHHENWGLVLTGDRVLHLAPSFDHASSLGRIESDKEKLDRLRTKDQFRTVEAYAKKASSAFHLSQTSTTPLSTLEAFYSIAKLHTSAALAWLKRLEEVSPEQTMEILSKVPKDRISDISIEFAQKVLLINRERLLGLVGQLV
ncbi:MAG: hypothetical protein KC588_02145 [Nitrospira sp.]|nr:hypothetical protein [Nitrospira sp.]